MNSNTMGWGGIGGNPGMNYEIGFPPHMGGGQHPPHHGGHFGMEPTRITWVSRSNGACDNFAERAGKDVGGKDIYVARAHHNGGLLPGKLCEGYNFAHVGCDMKEHTYSQYEVLTAPRGTLSWVETKKDKIPHNAVQGGYVAGNREPLYIGRVLHQGTMQVGKVHRSHGSCYISFGETEHGYTTYEILVKNKLGELLQV